MLQAETEALAPWKLAIAQARQARRPGRAGPGARRGALTAAQARPLAAEPVADAAGTASPASPAVPPAAQPEPRAPIQPAPAQVALQQAPCSTGAPAAAKPECAARGVRGASVPARLAARPRAHAPERVVAAAATAPAAPPAAPASARAEPLAPIPSPPTRAARDQALAGAGAAPAAKAHATGPAAGGASSAPAPVRLAALPKAHAPEGQPARHALSRSDATGAIAQHGRRPHAPVTAAAVTPRTDNAAIRRASAQWRAAQRIAAQRMLGRS